MPPIDEPHDCAWREEALQLRAKLDEMEQLKVQLAALQKYVFGKRSEKMPPVAAELRRTGATKPDPAAAKKKRDANAEKKKALPAREVRHVVPATKKHCAHCKSHDFTPLGPGKESVIYEYVAAQLERQLHRQETLACPCGKTIVTADGPPRVGDQGAYGPGFIAHLVTAKCADAIPLNRVATQLHRIGVPMARSTLVDLFQRAGSLLAPLAKQILERIAAGDIVLADETTQRVQAAGKTRRAYLWTFLSGNYVGFRFSASRSGKTPSDVLGGSTGTLVVDAYSGYNDVTTPEGRTRAGCLAHARRGLFDALSTSPIAQQALDLILAVYRVEHDARQAGIIGTPAHLEMRQTRSAAHMQALHDWLVAQQPLHLPQGPLAKAIGYALNNWEALTRFLGDARIPPDNNRSENALRIAAQGRKSFLFVGNDAAGENLAVLYTLVKSAEAHGLNPESYLADVLLRVSTHPNGKLDELLPHLWQPTPPAQAA